MFNTTPGRLLLLLAMAGLSLLGHLGLQDVTNVNEGQRLLPAAEMLETGDWVVPRKDGQPYIAKPPLTYWMLAGAYQLAGRPSLLAGRLVVALSALAAVLCLAVIGTQHVGRRAGFWSAVILATSVYFARESQLAEIDPVLTLALLIAVYALWRSTAEPQPRRRMALWSAGIFFGLALLLKGPPVFLFFLAAAVAIQLTLRPRPALFARRLLAVLAIALLLFLPWAALLIHRVGAATAWQTLWNEALLRTVTSSRINSGPIYYYLVQGAAGLLPWSWLLLLYTSRTCRADQNVHDPRFLRFTAWYAALAFGLFSLIRGKETTYILPLYPFFALFAGRALVWLIYGGGETDPVWRWARWPLAFFALACALSPAVLLTPYAAWFTAMPSLIPFLVAGAALAAAGLWTLARNRRQAALLFFACGFTLCSRATLDARKLLANADRSLRPFASALAERHARGDLVYRWRNTNAHHLWYLRQATTRLDHLSQLRASAANPNSPVFVVLENKRIAEFLREYGPVPEPARLSELHHENYTILALPPPDGSR